MTLPLRIFNTHPKLHVLMQNKKTSSRFGEVSKHIIVFKKLIMLTVTKLRRNLECKLINWASQILHCDCEVFACKKKFSVMFSFHVKTTVGVQFFLNLSYFLFLETKFINLCSIQT